MCDILSKTGNSHKEDVMGVQYNETIDRMRWAGKLKNDSAIARALGVTPQAFSSYKKRGSIPSDLILKFASMIGLSVDWLITGDGEMYKQGGAATGAQAAGEKFGVLGYPTMLVFDSDGNELTRIPGGIDIQAYANILDLTLSDLAPVGDLVNGVVSDGKPLDARECRLLAYYSWHQSPALIEQFDETDLHFHTGVSYRHLTVFNNVEFDVQTYPPHDNIGIVVDKIMPRGKGADRLIELIRKSQELFTGHEINKVRMDLEENPASSIWLWGQGKKAAMERFSNRFGVRGAVITAVDLVRGLAKLIGFDLIEN